MPEAVGQLASRWDTYYDAAPREPVRAAYPSPGPEVIKTTYRYGGYSLCPRYPSGRTGFVF